MNFVNGIFITILEILVFGTCVKINKLQVPQVIQHGRAVVLDCDFTLEETDQDLVVKWFFNKNNQTLVYQWIPASKNKPQALGVLKNRLNLGYKAGEDANSIHRALHILQAAPDLSGDYTCSVSTIQSEDIQTKRMLVFVPENNLMIHRFGSEKQGVIRLECIAEGVFPKPEMSIYSHKRGPIKTELSSKARGGSLYDVSARTITLDSLEDPEEFSCELKIPQANYTVRQKTVVYPSYIGNKGLRVRGDIWMISTCTFILSQALTGTSFRRRMVNIELVS